MNDHSLNISILNLRRSLDSKKLAIFEIYRENGFICWYFSACEYESNQFSVRITCETFEDNMSEKKMAYYFTAFNLLTFNCLSFIFINECSFFLFPSV